jgi:DNA mismatch repair protein MutS
LQVASLAGVPNEVIKNARKQLRTLEQQSAMQNPQGDLFAAVAIPPNAQDSPEPVEHPAVAALRNAQPDELSPKAALEKLYQLKSLV